MSHSFVTGWDNRCRTGLPALEALLANKEGGSNPRVMEGLERGNKHQVLVYTIMRDTLELCYEAPSLIFLFRICQAT